MIKLYVGKGKESGKRFVALIFVKGDGRIYLTFDRLTIMRVTDLTINQLEGLDFGEYDI